MSLCCSCETITLVGLKPAREKWLARSASALKFGQPQALRDFPDALPHNSIKLYAISEFPGGTWREKETFKFEKLPAVLR